MATQTLPSITLLNLPNLILLLPLSTSGDPRTNVVSSSSSAKSSDAILSGEKPESGTIRGERAYGVGAAMADV